MFSQCKPSGLYPELYGGSQLLKLIGRALMLRGKVKDRQKRIIIC